MNMHALILSIVSAVVPFIQSASAKCTYIAVVSVGETKEITSHGIIDETTCTDLGAPTIDIVSGGARSFIGFESRKYNYAATARCGSRNVTKTAVNFSAPGEAGVYKYNYNVALGPFRDSVELVVRVVPLQVAYGIPELDLELIRQYKIPDTPGVRSVGCRGVLISRRNLSFDGLS